MNLSELREQFKINQKQAATAACVPLRTYIRFESNDSYGSPLKRQSIINNIVKEYEITETKGVLSIDQIRDSLTSLFRNKYFDSVDFCYLFGSYAKGNAKDGSDVDLYVSTSLSGLDFVGLMEDIRETLHKEVDVINKDELNNNIALTEEIMKYGVRIYEK